MIKYLWQKPLPYLVNFLVYLFYLDLFQNCIKMFCINISIHIFPLVWFNQLSTEESNFEQNLHALNQLCLVIAVSINVF